MSWYLDSSAILKLVFDEKERGALLRIIKSPSTSSRISKLEVRRTVNRLAPSRLDEAGLELEKINLYPVSTLVLAVAENFSRDITLRSLDAIHVATVISLGHVVQGLISYDKQMIANATLLGVKVISPGMK